MRSIIATAAFCAVLSFYPALADEQDKQEPLRIEMDQKAKAFIFIIDDVPVAWLDRHGLDVVEHLSYGGMLTDKGRESARRDIEQKIREQKVREAADE